MSENRKAGLKKLEPPRRGLASDYEQPPHPANVRLVSEPGDA